MICECGTAYRVMKHMTGEHPFNVITFAQLIARYLHDGRIKLDKSKTKGRSRTTIPARSLATAASMRSLGYVIRELTDDFVDMTPNRKANWCCGGGGGLVVCGTKTFV